MFPEGLGVPGSKLTQRMLGNDVTGVLAMSIEPGQLPEEKTDIAFKGKDPFALEDRKERKKCTDPWQPNRPKG